jgi:flagellar biosynthesis GTPase FlhF
MTDDELRAIVESTARSTAANSDAIAELRAANSDAIAELRAAGLRTEESLNSFIQRVESWLEALQNVGDDQADDLANLTSNDAHLESLFNNLRGEAIADRLEFRTQAEADRQAFRDALEADRAKSEADSQAFRDALEADRARSEADRAEWRASFDAQQEVIQRLLLEIRSSNGEISQLSDRVDNLEQAG